MQPLLFIINRLSVGGAERLLIDELHELHRRGIKVHLVTLHKEGRTSLLQELNIPQECIHTLNVGSLFDLVGWVRLVRFMRTLNPRTVVCHLWYANTVGRIAAKLAHVQNVIVFEHNVYDRVKTRKQLFIDTHLQRWAKTIVAVSEEVKNSLITHGISGQRIAVLSNAIDARRYQEAVAVDLRAAYGLPEDSVVLLAVGRLTRQKGIDVLVRALVLLPKTVHAVILGVGEEEESLRALAKDLGVESQMHLVGIRHDIPAVLKGADCLVMPSRWEGEPIVLLEALAAGVPVVGSDIPPLRKVIIEGVNGFLSPSEDAALLAEAVKKGIEGSLKKNAPSLPPDRTIERHVDGLLALVQ